MNPRESDTSNGQSCNSDVSPNDATKDEHQDEEVAETREQPMATPLPTTKSATNSSNGEMKKVTSQLVPVNNPEEIAEADLKLNRVGCTVCSHNDDDYDNPADPASRKAIKINNNNDTMNNNNGHDGDNDNQSFEEHLRHWWCPCLSWSRQRTIVAVLGCCSSSIILSIRLVLDNRPSTYVIHAIIIFFDMILIHLFTFSKWLSVSGEILTIVCFLLFHYTKESIYEFLETTLIAALCSFHMILSRNKHWDHETELEDEMASLRDSIRSIHDGSHNRPGSSSFLSTDDQLQRLEQKLTRRRSQSSRALYSSRANDGDSLILPQHSRQNHHKNHHHQQQRHHKTRAHLCCENFFEHFLDGSAGVMYTSFLGLIIDEALNYGKKCEGEQGYN